MVEKALHTGNIAAAFAVLATTADLTLAGGAGTAIGAALSAVGLFKSKPNKVQTLALALADAMDAHAKNEGLPQDVSGTLAEMLKLAELTEQQMASDNMVAADIAKSHRDRTEAAAIIEEHKTPYVLAAFEKLICATLEPILTDPDFVPQTQGAVNQALLQRMAALENAAEQNGYAQRMLDAGITEDAITGLAQRIAENVDDLNQAWAELQNAVEVALRLQAEGARGSNHGDFVDQVLATVADHAKRGEYAAAQGAIAAALAEEEAAHQARQGRLYASGIETAVLARDAATAAGYLVAKAQADGEGSFEELRAARRRYYEEGRDKGLNFQLEIAIALAEQICDRATTPDERGTAQNDLGNALQTLGARESGTERLEQAVDAYRAALQERTQDRVPLDWAMTQSNLGTALQTLGERESGTERLEEAVDAFHAALEERTQDRVPLEWAMTQNNLGNALLTFGERESGTDRLEQAVEAYRAALEERTRDRVPLDWAMTQNNLGSALKTLGERESGTARLQQAVDAYRAALEELTQDRVPLNWAATIVNMAAVQGILGERLGDIATVEHARDMAVSGQEVLADGGHDAWAQATLSFIEKLDAILSRMGSNDGAT